MTAKVKVGDVEVNGMIMVPYDDKRTREVDLDGSLGQAFFRDYNVTINWHKKSFWLQPRAANPASLAAERLRRWGPAFDKCQNPACVKVEVVGEEVLPLAGGETPEAEPPPLAPQRATLRITRETGAPDHDYEVLLEALDAAGNPIGLPRILATMEKGVPSIEKDVDPNYGKAAKLAVIDLSPFPRECQQKPCIWSLPLR
jgi:hypothetical protein